MGMKKKNRKYRILIVDDEQDMRWILRELIEDKGYDPFTAENGEEALNTIVKHAPDLMLMDIKMPVMDGMTALEKAQEINADLPIIMMTAFSDTQTAVKAMKLGAYDYLVKPFDNEELIITIERALEKSTMAEELTLLRRQLEVRQDLRHRMGNSEEVQSLSDDVLRVAYSDFSVMIQGESGSGKELVAEAIHLNSSRSENAFIEVDCGAIPDTLIESELFGYERGAYTGADKRKAGYFETAHKGTLFLDEISNLPVAVQPKLLRAIQTKTVTHLGRTKKIPVDIRIICASNQNLLNAVKKGKFREDLYYRLNEFEIDVPALRHRKDDIPFLAHKFLNEAADELKKEVGGFSKQCLRLLLGYNWPGNVRELRNVVRRATLIAGLKVTPKCLPGELNHDGEAISLGAAESLLDQGLSWKELKQYHQRQLEEHLFSKTLEKTGGNKRKAAQLLKMDYKTFHTKVKNLGI